ncbi:DUF2513 domain-containing protein [Vibrio parahaemolyticus]|nr:DUF2513 domain-containing protein [Vibrio parahaemolyticus]TNZ88968.1 hypothetical protein CGK37_21445 [Vibrio parahaemolyticus]TOA10907.1 hypothetical protein CGK34_20405 [Vibrio parahaemolyticus]
MMKRDMDLARKLMLEVESHPSHIESIKFPNYSQEEVYYHVALLIDAGLLKGDYMMLKNASMAPAKIYIEKLTWEGHEFLDDTRKENVWEVIKADFRDDSLATIKAVAKDLASGLAKKKVKAILGENE